MASAEANADLLNAVVAGSMRRVKAALAVGANVNGSTSTELHGPPITAAAARNNADLVNFLIEQGADPDGPAEHEMPCKKANVVAMAGDTPLHIAVKQGNLEITRSLLNRAHANPNAANKRAATPLIVACTCPHNYVADLVRLLLEAGAEPTLANDEGYNAVHTAVRYGLLDVVGILHTAVPSTLGSSAANSDTPLFMACSMGNEAMVSRLISLGAIDQTILDSHFSLPIAAAVMHGFVGVVRLLIKEGLPAIGGAELLPHVLFVATCAHRAKSLQLLLAAEGGERRSHWAMADMDGQTLLHHGAGECCPAAVSVLLAAGADEDATGNSGLLPRDVIGADLKPEQLPMNRGKEVAIRRMLEQGPAYRARSWAWPTEEADTDRCGDGNGAVLSAAPSVPKLTVGMRIFRPKSDKRFFARVVGRYCEKD